VSVVHRGDAQQVLRVAFAVQPSVPHHPAPFPQAPPTSVTTRAIASTRFHRSDTAPSFIAAVRYGLEGLRTAERVVDQPWRDAECDRGDAGRQQRDPRSGPEERRGVVYGHESGAASRELVAPHGPGLGVIGRWARNLGGLEDRRKAGGHRARQRRAVRRRLNRLHRSPTPRAPRTAPPACGPTGRACRGCCRRAS